MHYEYRSDQGYLVAGASDAYSLVLISIYGAGYDTDSVTYRPG